MSDKLFLESIERLYYETTLNPSIFKRLYSNIVNRHFAKDLSDDKLTYGQMIHILRLLFDVLREKDWYRNVTRYVKRLNTDCLKDTYLAPPPYLPSFELSVTSMSFIYALVVVRENLLKYIPDMTLCERIMTKIYNTSFPLRLRDDTIGIIISEMTKMVPDMIVSYNLPGKDVSEEMIPEHLKQNDPWKIYEDRLNALTCTIDELYAKIEALEEKARYQEKLN